MLEARFGEQVALDVADSQPAQGLKFGLRLDPLAMTVTPSSAAILTTAARMIRFSARSSPGGMLAALPALQE